MNSHVEMDLTGAIYAARAGNNPCLGLSSTGKGLSARGKETMIRAATTVFPFSIPEPDNVLFIISGRSLWR